MGCDPTDSCRARRYGCAAVSAQCVVLPQGQRAIKKAACGRLKNTNEPASEEKRRTVSARAETVLLCADRSPGFRSSYSRAFPKIFQWPMRFRRGYSGGAVQDLHLIPVICCFNVVIIISSRPISQPCFSPLRFTTRPPHFSDVNFFRIFLRRAFDF